MKHYYLIVVFSLFITDLLVGQNNTDYIIAKEYYNKGEFDKASHLFEKIFKKTKTQDVYAKYLDCLIKTQSYKDAEKLMIKIISNILNEKKMKLAQSITALILLKIGRYILQLPLKFKCCPH